MKGGIRITARAREIMGELNQLCDKFDAETRTLADRTIAENVAIDIGASRESTRRAIVGTAYRLAQEIRGRTPRKDQPC
jgi:hypothetical protein